MKGPAFALTGCSAMVAALYVPGHPLGAAVVVVVALATVAILTSEPHLGARFWTFGILCWALVLPAVFIAAPWVVAIDLLGAAALGAVALSQATSSVGLLRTVLVPARFITGLRVFVGPVRGAAQLVTPRWARLFRVAIVSLVLVVVFGGLFVSADRAFAAMAERVFAPRWDLPLMPARIAVATGVCGVVGALVNTRVLAAQPIVRLDPFAPSTERSRSPWRDWAFPLVVLNLLFLSFVVVQFAVLFGGNTHVLETSGLTYSEYARQGFFQLLAVGGLTMITVVLAAFTAPDDEREQRRIRFLLGGLCVMSLIVLASALKRLGLYEEAFGYTTVRLLAHTTILWMGALFLLLLAGGITRRSSVLPLGALALTAATVAGLSFANPERIVATHNVERYEATGNIDPGYLSTLGEDAVPALTRLPVGLQSCVLGPIAARVEPDDSWAAFNVARRDAAEILSSTDQEVGSC